MKSKMCQESRALEIKSYSILRKEIMFSPHLLLHNTPIWAKQLMQIKTACKTYKSMLNRRVFLLKKYNPVKKNIDLLVHFTKVVL